MPEIERKFDRRESGNNSIIDTHSKVFRALYFWGKLMGINPLTLTKNSDLEFSYVGLFYGIFLASVSCYIFYCVLIERIKLLLPGETPIAIIVDFMGISLQFLENMSTFFVFAIYQKRAKKIVDSFVAAEKTSRKLGILDDYEKYLKQFGFHVTVNNIVNLASMVFSEILRSYVHTFEMLVWWSFNFITAMSFNMVLLFVSSLLLLKHKFRKLNEKVRLLMQEKCSRQSEEIVTASICTNFFCCNSHCFSDRITIISQLHRELRDVIRRIEELFMPLLFFTIAKNFTFITFQTYMVYSYTKGHRPLGKIDLLFVGATTHWILNASICLFVISNVCGTILYEANNTGHILHMSLNNNKNFGDIHEAARITINLRNFQAFDLFSLDLLQNRINISVLGLFKLDNFLFYSTLATGMTYLTIMLQFYS